MQKRVYKTHVSKQKENRALPCRDYSSIIYNYSVSIDFITSTSVYHYFTLLNYTFLKLSVFQLRWVEDLPASFG